MNNFSSNICHLLHPSLLANSPTLLQKNTYLTSVHPKSWRLKVWSSWMDVAVLHCSTVRDISRSRSQCQQVWDAPAQGLCWEFKAHFIWYHGHGGNQNSNPMFSGGKILGFKWNVFTKLQHLQLMELKQVIKSTLCVVMFRDALCHTVGGGLKCLYLRFC